MRPWKNVRCGDIIVKIQRGFQAARVKIINHFGYEVMIMIGV